MPVRPLVALVALAEEAMPSASAIVEFLRGCARGVPAAQIEEASAGWVVLRHGDMRATLSLEPTPLARELVEAAGPRAWYWTEAIEALAGHTAHLALAVATEEEDRVTGAWVLTALVAAVAADGKATAVYWADSGLFHPPEAFLDACHDEEEGLPLSLWLDLELFDHEDGSHSLATAGLEPFSLPEVEIHHSGLEPSHLAELSLAMAHYLLENGPILEDNETFELSDEQRVQVRFHPSLCDPDRPALLLVPQ